MSGFAFLSYSRTDVDYVRRLAEYLRARGIDTWYDGDLTTGRSFDEELAERIVTCAVFIVVLTPAAVESKWVARELSYADDHDRQILPLMREWCHRLPLRIHNVQHENVTGGQMPPDRFVETVRKGTGSMPVGTSREKTQPEATWTKIAHGETVDARLQVRQVAKLLRRFYLDTGSIEASDLDGRPAEERDQRLLSRALTAQAVRMVTGFSHADAALTVIDGVGDQGIDAIAVVKEPDPHVYLVQSKWSKDGRARSDRGAVHELGAGLRLIDEQDFAGFNPRGQQLAAQVSTVLRSGPVPVTQVYILMRTDDVTDGFTDALVGEQRKFNRFGEVLDHKIILAGDVWESVRSDTAPPPIELKLKLFPWYSVNAPYQSYQGVISASQVAEWRAHGSSLFNLGIRNPLGRTSINDELIETLTGEPAHFWYFNNGVTIVCESAEVGRRSIRSPEGNPIELTLRSARVINGVQTVMSVAEAVAADPEARSAQVSVRIIVTGSAEQFAKQATQSSNRQNRVEARDFITLDPVQASIAEEMRTEIGLEYSIRRGELEPQADTGCSVVEAASALACLHPDARYAAQIATTLDALWERGPQGVYDALFRPQPSVYRLWNAVRVIRSVRRCLHELHRHYGGRGAALIDNGAYLLGHLVFRRLDLEMMEEPDFEDEWWKQADNLIRPLVGQLLPALAAEIDNLYGERSQIRSICSDVDRCRDLVNRVLSSSSGVSVHDKYRRPRPQQIRRPAAVQILIDKAVLAEGDPLTLTHGSAAEAEALQEWLTEDPRRSHATWVADRKKPILWVADGKTYSPSGLITHIWESAGWSDRPVAVQGTAQWRAPTGESLADLARRALRELDASDDTETH